MQFSQKNIKILVLSLFIFSVQGSFGQENEQLIDTGKNLENFISKQPFEKTYLHTDKDYYFVDETIWLKLYLLNGSSHINSTKSQLVYIELLDDKGVLVTQKKLYVENLGAQGHIELNNAMKSGIYTLRAFTLYMLNESNPVIFEKQITFFERKLKAPPTNTKLANTGVNNRQTVSFKAPLKIIFFPEGGNLVNGIETFMVFMVTDKNGKAIAADGKIIDNQNRIVSFFKSQEFGLGTFKIKPESDKKYYAVFSDSLRYPLPKVSLRGYVLNTKNKGNAIVINVKTNILNGLDGTYIIGHLRGQIIYKQKISVKKNNNSYRIRFLTDNLSDGVAQFTLFRADGEPVCERLVFINRSDNDITLSIDTDRSFYGPRQQVSAKLKLTDTQDNPISGVMSLAVTSADRLNLTTRSPFIDNWLSLNSDIGSSIANPGFFFKDNSFGRSYLLDALMMTNSWRGFNWKETLRAKNQQELGHIPEKGVMIKGSIVDFKTKMLPKEASVTLNLLGLTDGMYSEEQITDSQGKFSFGPYIFLDTLKAVINAESLEKRKNGKSKNLAILLQDTFSFKKQIRKNNRKNIFVLQDEKDSRPAQFSTIPKIADFQTDAGTIELDEVLIVEKKKTRQDSINSAFKKLMPLYGTPTKRLFIDSIPGSNGLTVFDVLRRSSGAQIIDQKLLLRQHYGGNPLFIVDGMTTTADVVRSMNTTDIEFIDVLHPTAAGAYINRAVYGVVAIYSKGSLNLPRKNRAYPVANINGFEVIGFAKAGEFSVTDYSDKNLQYSALDNRSTLHWMPDIWLGGPAKQNDSDISFYTGDVPGSYVIKVEGVTTDGRPISALKVIEVGEK